MAVQTIYRCSDGREFQPWERKRAEQHEENLRQQKALRAEWESLVTPDHSRREG